MMSAAGVVAGLVRRVRRVGLLDGRRARTGPSVGLGGGGSLRFGVRRGQRGGPVVRPQHVGRERAGQGRQRRVADKPRQQRRRLRARQRLRRPCGS